MERPNDNQNIDNGGNIKKERKNQNDIKDQFHEAVESSSKAVLDAVKMRRKNNI